MSFMRSVNTGVYHSGISLTARYFYISDHWLTTLDDNGKKIHKIVLHFCDLQENELAMDCPTGGRSHYLTLHK